MHYENTQLKEKSSCGKAMKKFKYKRFKNLNKFKKVDNVTKYLANQYYIFTEKDVPIPKHSSNIC